MIPIKQNLTVLIVASLVAALSGCIARIPEPQPVYPVLSPVISEEAISVESFAPLASDGHRGEGFFRKPPGEGPFPAVILIHGGLPRRPTAQIRAYMVGTHASRFLEAGYVVAVITYRGRDRKPRDQTPATVLDCVAAVETLGAMPFVDRSSIAVSGTSGGGDLAREVAAATPVAATVPEEPATVLMAGLVNENSQTARAVDYLELYRAQPDHSTFLTKLARIESPILIIAGTHTTHSGINQWNEAILVPALRDANKSVEVITFPGEPHTFSFASSPEQTPRPAAAQKAFHDISSFLQRHLPTLPRPLDPELVHHAQIAGKRAEQR
ncbi:MAG: alpha/beta hydrolase family protein [Myxococcota bacterium]